MLTEEQMEEKLRGYAETFNRNVREREWGKAHNVYNIILETAVMAEMSKEFMKELFGNYDHDDGEYGWDDGGGKVPDDGKIRRADVEKVNMECCIRRNMAYEDMACRRLGLPLGMYRNYSDADYCARCSTKK